MARSELVLGAEILPRDIAERFRAAAKSLLAQGTQLVTTSSIRSNTEMILFEGNGDVLVSLQAQFGSTIQQLIVWAARPGRIYEFHLHGANDPVCGPQRVIRRRMAILTNDAWQDMVQDPLVPWLVSPDPVDIPDDNWTDFIAMLEQTSLSSARLSAVIQDVLSTGQYRLPDKKLTGDPQSGSIQRPLLRH